MYDIHTIKKKNWYGRCDDDDDDGEDDEKKKNYRTPHPLINY